MSSINLHTTYYYSQPTEYRFSHDSVFLARQVFELYQDTDVTLIRGLDLCSGSGIIGLDFIYHCLNETGQVPKYFDFLDVQAVYQEHFQENIRRLKNAENLKNKEALNTQFNFIEVNYNSLSQQKNSKKYNLILCNPPYFFPEMGTLSPSEFKNRCRFFIDSDFKSLLLGIGNCLDFGGVAYLLLRDLSEHGWNSVNEARAILPDTFRLDVLGDIRGTYFVKFSYK